MHVIWSKNTDSPHSNSRKEKKWYGAEGSTQAYQKILYKVFLLLAAAFTIPATIATIAQINFVVRSNRTLGTVVAFEQVENVAPAFSDPEGGILYYPVIQFFDEQRSAVQFTAAMGKYRHAFELNEQVPVRYLAGESQTGRIDKFWYIWGRAVIFWGLAIFCALVGVMMPYSFRMGKQRNDPDELSDDDTKEDPASKEGFSPQF